MFFLARGAVSRSKQAGCLTADGIRPELERCLEEGRRMSQAVRAPGHVGGAASRAGQPHGLDGLARWTFSRARHSHGLDGRRR